MAKPTYKKFPHPITPALLNGIRTRATSIMHRINTLPYHTGVCEHIRTTYQDAAFLYVFWNMFAMIDDHLERPYCIFVFSYYRNAGDVDGHEQRDRTMALATIAAMSDKELAWFLRRPSYNTLIPDRMPR